MLPNYQNADMLDIIFENRNHAYGAYALRRNYNKSLQQAMLITVSSVFLLLFGNFLREKFSKNLIPAPPTTVVVKPSDIGHNPLPKKEVLQAKPPKPPKPPVQPHTQAAATATIRNTEVHVVQNNRVEQDTIIPTRELPTLNSGETTNTVAPATGMGVSDGTGTDRKFEVRKNDVPTLRFVEIMPQFPGGDEALMKFLANNTVYPEMERSTGTQGRTYIQFVVNEDGSITNASVKSSESYGFSKEALRVVSLLPKFKPGLQEGHPVKVQYILPFTFKIKP